MKRGVSLLLLGLGLLLTNCGSGASSQITTTDQNIVDKIYGQEATVDYRQGRAISITCPRHMTEFERWFGLAPPTTCEVKQPLPAQIGQLRF